jgi:putative CRISPR-associated protein (TIGR02619 family)
MRRVVISTIGTSLLTNPINRANPDEKDWYEGLRDTANLSATQTPKDVLRIIKTLEERAKQKLSQSQVHVIRKASAELNGIYGLYEEQMHQGNQDIHWLIATDTAQGRATAEIVETFLKSQSLPNVNIYVPLGLSMASTSAFSDGIDKLIAWMQETIPVFKDRGYKVYFNLVGSFKSLQGYLNTIGMFYADEIIYIFEGQESQLVTIPRLPITVDKSVIEPYKVQLALMDAGAEISITEKTVQNIPESLVFSDDKEMTLSTWGKLVWIECKEELLSQKLLLFPKIEYEHTFVDDYERLRDKKERLKLQETIAKVSHVLIRSKGDTTPLKQDGGLQYDKYTNMGELEHFRVTEGLRVSCIATAGNLKLRRYGTEPDVNNNP